MNYLSKYEYIVLKNHISVLTMKNQSSKSVTTKKPCTLRKTLRSTLRNFKKTKLKYIVYWWTYRIRGDYRSTTANSPP